MSSADLSPERIANAARALRLEQGFTGATYAIAEAVLRADTEWRLTHLEDLDALVMKKRALDVERAEMIRRAEWVRDQALAAIAAVRSDAGWVHERDRGWIDACDRAAGEFLRRIGEGATDADSLARERR